MLATGVAVCARRGGDACVMNRAGEGRGGPLTKLEVVPSLIAAWSSWRGSGLDGRRAALPRALASGDGGCSKSSTRSLTAMAHDDDEPQALAHRPMGREEGRNKK